ncbi:uncharacterized protein LOC134082130 [Sardina pilchardus]|uniref:uncharacterized protein LOC134082130 n=1 Tax=Sardina pilchardus TaxID=27697 RepID=UPI002E135B11
MITAKIVVTVLMLSVTGSLDAAPPGQPFCKAARQPNGSFVFHLWPTKLVSDYESQIIIEKKVSAIYEGGKVPASWLPPVLSVTMQHFTLSTCPKSVKIGLDGANEWSLKDLICSCDSSTSTAQTSSSTAKPPSSASNLTWTNNDTSPFPVGAVIACSLLVLLGFVIFICWLMKYRRTGVRQTATIVHHASSFKEETVSILDITATSSLKTSDGQLK